MKHTLLFAFCLWMHGLVATSATDVLDQRYYVTYKDILIGDNGLFVNLDGHVTPVDFIGCDHQGIYVEQLTTEVPVYCVQCGRTWIRGKQSAMCPHPPKRR